VVGFDAIVAIQLVVMSRLRKQFVHQLGVHRCPVGHQLRRYGAYSVDGPFEDARAAVVSRLVETYTSMTCP
jgi:hypothetical protein